MFLAAGRLPLEKEGSFSRLTLSSNQGIHGLECGITLTGESVTMGAQRAAWAAASIRPKQWSCAEAHVLKDKRFLAEDAPRLPLEGCPLGETCPCVYLKYDDRRAGPVTDRRNGAGDDRHYGASFLQAERTSRRA